MAPRWTDFGAFEGGGGALKGFEVEQRWGTGDVDREAKSIRKEDLKHLFIASKYKLRIGPELTVIISATNNKNNSLENHLPVIIAI